MISVLGDGQFGEVWLVEATVDGEKEKFALKRQAKKDNLADIEREITVTQQLTTSHPCIVDLLHTFETEDSIHMLMGLVTGGDLWGVVYSEDEDGDWTSGIPESQAKFYALVMADTLSYMHAQKYVYRDLKPENIMIGDDGYPVIVDFGFTKQLCEDMTFTFCGTPNYIAPEIIKNTGHNAGADHWALGVLIYEMIAGEHPFYVDGMDNTDVFEAICIEKQYPLSKLKEDVSEATFDLVDGLLAKEPSLRLGMLAGKEGDILNHKWFNGLDLCELRAKKAEAPWIPPR
jgi:serine/threonine protein kinase